MIEPLTKENVPALQRFFDDLSDEDITFVREDVRSPDVVTHWLDVAERAGRWVELHDGAVYGFVGVFPLVGWSRHVGELRLVVDPGRRREGVGTRLARFALEQAVAMHLTKLIVEVVAQQQATLTMFDRLGFEAEALLRDHIRDRQSELQDVVLLAYLLDEVGSAIEVSGVADEAKRSIDG
jgi:RimJ/RimL family protein N-acetyltransferase